ncbi:MAG: helix-turn-helix domain-containing protein [Clostridiales bacterium]|jgi:DNA-binding Xre family transcriptional regulator|nr:helix-turn-helix domain-containing protein [Clostridiales bacterium]
MAIKYYKLFDILQRRGLTRTQFAENVGISSATLAKISAHKYISMEILDRICKEMTLQPGDIIEYEEDSQ